MIYHRAERGCIAGIVSELPRVVQPAAARLLDHDDSALSTRRRLA